MRILFVLIIVIFLVPGQSLGGIPIQLEDLALLAIILFFPKINYEESKTLLTLLVAVAIAGLVTFTIQVFSGYKAVIQDLNTIFSLIRNFVIFLAGLKLGKSISKNSVSQVLIVISIGFLASALISIVQFYDIAGMGIRTFLMFGTEKGIEYGVTRAIGVAGNPNYAAFFQICGIIAIISLPKLKNRITQVIALSLIGLFLVSIYVTFSRTGILAVILIALTYLLINRKFAPFILLGLLFIIIAPFFNDLVEGTRYGSLLSKNSEVVTLNGRVDEIWNKKLEGFYRNPLWGVSAAKGSKSGTIFDNIIFDNSFLYLLVTSGIIGTFLTLAFNVKIISKIRKLKEDHFTRYIILLHVNIAIFYLTTDLVKAVMFTSFYFLTMGLFLTYLYERHNEQKSTTIDINSDTQLE